MELLEIVNKLIGKIEPIGESNTDADRLSNLGDQIQLTDDLIYQIVQVSENKTRHEHSMKKAGESAHKWLEETHKYLSEILSKIPITD